MTDLESRLASLESAHAALQEDYDELVDLLEATPAFREKRKAAKRAKAAAVRDVVWRTPAGPARDAIVMLWDHKDAQAFARDHLGTDHARGCDPVRAATFLVELGEEPRAKLLAEHPLGRVQKLVEAELAGELHTYYRLTPRPGTEFWQRERTVRVDWRAAEDLVRAGVTGEWLESSSSGPAWLNAILVREGHGRIVRDTALECLRQHDKALDSALKTGKLVVTELDREHSRKMRLWQIQSGDGADVVAPPRERAREQPSEVETMAKIYEQSR